MVKGFVGAKGKSVNCQLFTLFQVCLTLFKFKLQRFLKNILITLGQFLFTLFRILKLVVRFGRSFNLTEYTKIKFHFKKSRTNLN